jgi:hypothetical protein
MSSLQFIELSLNIDTTNMRLYDGLKKRNKNQFFWFRNQYLIVKLPNNLWFVIECSGESIELLNENIFYYERYVRTKTGCFHNLLMTPPKGLVVDHINRKTWDNRCSNLRIVTQRINTQNKSIYSSNRSGVTGVSKQITKNYEYYRSSIFDNEGIEHYKLFSINKLGEVNAKNQAIAQRQAWKIQFNYLGE